jgi:hypothetical protein
MNAELNRDTKNLK